MTPIYQGVPRPVVVSMLLPVFLPFNLVKTVANSAFAMMIYKPLVNALRRAKIITISSNNSDNNSQMYVYNEVKPKNISTFYVYACSCCTLFQ